MEWFRKRGSREDRLLEEAAGPCPWYTHRSAARVKDYRWERLADESGYGLFDRAARLVLVLGMYCYAKSLGKGRLLLWHMLPSTGHREHVSFHILNVSDLEEIVDREQALERSKDELSRAFWIGPALAEAQISAATDVESIDVDLPAPFRDLGELILSAHTSPLWPG